MTLQIIGLSTPKTTLEVGQQFVVTVTYDVNNTNNKLTGLGFDIHFNDGELRLDSVNPTLTTNLFGNPSSGASLRSEDVSDNDPNTNKQLGWSYLDLLSSWPNQTLPVTLGTLTFTTLAPFDGSNLNVTFSSTAAGYTGQANPLVLTLALSNQPPKAVTLKNTTQTIAENTSTTTRIKVADIDITDDGLGTNNLSVSGTDTSFFEVDATGLYIKANTALNFEAKTSYNVTVNVDDTTVGNTPDATTNFTLTVTDVNEAPTAVSLNNQVTAIAENTSTATRIKVADIAITDDALGTNNLSVSGTDASFFEVDATGLYIKANTALNFEAKTSYNVTVNVDDTTVGNTPDATTNFTLTVTDVNEAPTAVSLNNQVTAIAENTSTATRIKVADIAITDDALGTNNLSVSGTDASFFEVDATGLYIKANTALNFEAKTSYNVIVNVDDTTIGNTPDAFANYTLSITNVNEAPTVVSAIADQTAKQGNAFSFQIPTNTFTDIDAGDVLTYSATLENGNALPSWLTFNSTTRTFSGTPTNDNVGNLNIKAIATDTAGATVSDIFTITVENVNSSIFITEVAPWSSSSSPVAADWFELTNKGTSAVNITGWKFDDNSNSFASAVALSGITSIGAGESVIFIEGATINSIFRSNWFGVNPPANLQIGNYTGSGIGLSTSGDAVNIYNAAGVLQANVVFGVSPAGPFA
ncbi:putative Ig domain-containing protein, partial [Aphanizomenon sp. PH219]|nr:putative Ig domain-containing protein [Aphanizomenon sp. PH219]